MAVRVAIVPPRVEARPPTIIRARRVPAHRLLVETDAPYLTPQAVRKQRNAPALVALTAHFVAEARGVSYAELEAGVERTAAELYGW